MNNWEEKNCSLQNQKISKFLHKQCIWSYKSHCWNLALKSRTPNLDTINPPFFQVKHWFSNTLLRFTQYNIEENLGYHFLRWLTRFSPTLCKLILWAEQRTKKVHNFLLVHKFCNTYNWTQLPGQQKRTGSQSDRISPTPHTGLATALDFSVTSL